MDSVFKTFCSQENVTDNCECYVVLARTDSGSHDVEVWRPGEPEKYTAEHIETLLLSQDLTLDVATNGYATNGYGVPGQIIKQDKSRNPAPHLRWPASVADGSWNEMLAVLEQLCEPLSALDYLSRIVDFKAWEHNALETAEGTISRLERRVRNQQQQIDDLQTKTDRQTILMLGASSLKDAVSRQWYNRSEVRRALDVFNPEN